MANAEIHIKPIAPRIGAEIFDLDLRKLADNGAWQTLNEKLLEHKVLVFRDQNLDPASLVAVANRFGKPMPYPFIEGLRDQPEVTEILKTESDERNFGGAWHSDTTYMEIPAGATLLYAVETPQSGGDTLFADMYDAYEQLSGGYKQMLDGVRALNDSDHGYGGSRKATLSKLDAIGEKLNSDADSLDAWHPVFRTHPKTGRRALYVNRGHTVRFEGARPEESRPIIEYLAKHATQPERTCRVRWQPHTLTLWDNRCTQHMALNDYPGQRRRMLRVTLEGERPRMKLCKAIAIFVALSLCQGVAAQTAVQSSASEALLHIAAAPDDPINEDLLRAVAEQVAGLEVEVHLFNSRSLLARLQSAHEFDLVLLEDSVSMVALRDAGLLGTYDAKGARHLDRRFTDSSKHFFPTRLSTIGIAHSRSADRRPTDWPELTRGIEPESISLPDPRESSATMVMVATLSRTNGIGWRFFKHLAIVGIKPLGDDQAALDNLITNQSDYAVLPEYLGMRERSDGTPIQFLNPRNGVPVLTFPLARLKSSTQLEATAAYIDAMLSKAGQKIVSKFGYRPILQGVRPRPRAPTSAALEVTFGAAGRHRGRPG